MPASDPGKIWAMYSHTSRQQKRPDSLLCAAVLCSRQKRMSTSVRHCGNCVLFLPTYEYFAIKLCPTSPNGHWSARPTPEPAHISSRLRLGCTKLEIKRKKGETLTNASYAKRRYRSKQALKLLHGVALRYLRSEMHQAAHSPRGGRGLGFYQNGAVSGRR